MTSLPAAARHPFPAYQTWWGLGTDFLRLMSAAIVGEWAHIDPPGNLGRVQGYAADFIQHVYRRAAAPDLAARFARHGAPLLSGEFDALSYAFFRAAFERLGAGDRRAFTARVGARFFGDAHDLLGLRLPVKVDSAAAFAALQENILRVGDFLLEQGYLREQFEFKFEVFTSRVNQPGTAFLPMLERDGVAHALYIMGYPVILPSAVILYRTMGEAQHHSSRTIEELFARCGLSARETDDFDPAGFPADRVVELWQVRRLETDRG
jgi:hypothetical protein